MTPVLAVLAGLCFSGQDALVAQETQPFVRGGIELRALGEEGKDWIFEAHWPSREQDDRGVLYLKRHVKLELRVRKRDLGPTGRPSEGRGELLFRMDRDEQAGRYVGPERLGRAYEGPIDLRVLEFEEGVPVLGSFGSNGGPYGDRPATTTRRYGRGIRGPDGEEWHGLSVWQDDSADCPAKGFGRARASDGRFLPLVIDPQTPIFSFVSDSAKAAAWFTTPAKVWHVPRIYRRSSYVERSVRLLLQGLGEHSAIEFRVDGKAWQKYPESGLRLARYRGKGRLLFEARFRGSSRISSRLIHVDPPFPSLAEGHPRPVLFADAEEERALRQRLRHGALARLFERLRDEGFLNGLSAGFEARQRSGRGAELRSARIALANAFVYVFDESPLRERVRYADAAKARLLSLLNIPPMGMELPLWFVSPCGERVGLGYEQLSLADAAIAYSLLIGSYRRSKKLSGGLTAIEDLKIRDALAGQAAASLRYRDNCQKTAGEGDAHWAAGLDMGLLLFSLCLPTYDTPWYGASAWPMGGSGERSSKGIAEREKGASPGGSGALPSWFRAVADPELESPGYPGVVAPSRIRVVFDKDGQWRGAKKYERLFREPAALLVNVLERAGQLRILPRLPRYLERLSKQKLSLPLLKNHRMKAIGLRAGHVDLEEVERRISVPLLAFWIPSGR